MLREAALRWFRTNLPHSQFQKDFLRHLDDAEATGKNLYLAIGPGLTRRGTPYMIHCFCGELFIFEMTPEQSQNFGLLPQEVKFRTGRMKDRLQKCESHSVALAQMTVEWGDAYLPGRPLIVDVSYKIEAPLTAPIAFRLDYDLKASTAAWHYPNQFLVPSGRYRCIFPPIDEETQNQAISGPIALFLRVYDMNNQSAGVRLPISNICGTLITGPRDLGRDRGTRA